MSFQNPESNVHTEQDSAALCWQAQRRDRILFFLIRLAVPVAALFAVAQSGIGVPPTVILMLLILTMLGWYLKTYDAPVCCVMDDRRCELTLRSGRRLRVMPGFGFLSTHLQLLSVQDASRRRHIVSAVAGISSAEQQRQLRRLLLMLPSLRLEHGV